MKTIISVFVLFFATIIQAEEVKSTKITDDIKYSVTVEQGMESQLKYGYFYATKPWTKKLSTTYSASVAIDSAKSEHMLDMYSQTFNISYSIGNGVSIYLLNDFNPHFHRTESWTSITYSW